MVKNKVLLLLPLTSFSNSLEEVYLRVVPKWTDEMVKHLCQQLKETLVFNNHETYDKLFNHEHYSLIRSIIKKQEGERKPRPSLVNLLDTTFKNFVDFRDNEESGCKMAIKINEVTIENSMMNAYTYSSHKDSVVIADCEALGISRNAIHLTDIDGNEISTDIINFTAKDLYHWFISHRNPPRVYDPNYKKHGKHEQMLKKGVKASKMTYRALEAQAFLHKAVGAEEDRKNLFFFDKSKKMMLVFWDEGLTPPKYHGYEVPYDNTIIQKIYSRGSTLLKKKIDTAAEWGEE